MTLKGNTADFGIETVLRLLGETKKTGELTLRSDKGAGALGLAEGRVVTAVFGDEAPIPALGSIWDMGSGVEFEFTPWNDPPPANLEGELQDNLRKADEYKKWRESVRQVIPHDRLRFRLSERAAEQGAVTFTSDRWRVVLAVNGQRDVNSLAEHLKVDRDTALTTLSGLVRDGVIETIEPPAETTAPPAPSPPPPPTFASPPSESVTPPTSEPVAPPASEPLFVQPSEPAPPPEAAAPPPEPVDWTAALLEKRQQQGAAPMERTPEWTPPAPIPETQWTRPAEPGTEEWAPPEPLAPQVPAPTYDTSDDTWTAPEPPVETPQWSPHDMEGGPTWTPPSPPAPEPAAPRVEAADAEAPWTRPTESAPEWTAPPAASVEPEAPPPAAPAFDDRLAALEGLFNPPPASEPTRTQEWTTPPPAQEWTPPPAPPAETPPAAEDPRLSALSAPPQPPPAAEAPPARPAAAPSSEWAPPPPAEPRAPEKKKGLFGGLFGARREEPARAAAMTDTGVSSQTGLLASFSNALLNEYNSGQYGKGKVDDRIPSLLMRVDEQADPIDKPLPIVDDRLDVQALERVGLPETQAVPYLAMLVSTIYADAEKAFGKDKAKRGYKAAQHQVFHGDTSALGGIAGKLPKI